MAASPSGLTTHPSLLVRARNPQDADAWRTFTAVYTPLVVRYCRRQGLQQADADDVTQEVLAQVARALPAFEYRPDRGRFRHWLGTVTRNKLRRFKHKQRRRQELVDLAPEQALESARPQVAMEWTSAFNEQVLTAACERIRGSFEAVTWRAFEMVWRDSRPAVEVAQLLDVPIHTVYAAKSRVLKRLWAEVLVLAEDLPYQLPRAGSA